MVDDRSLFLMAVTVLVLVISLGNLVDYFLRRQRAKRTHRNVLALLSPGRRTTEEDVENFQRAYGYPIDVGRAVYQVRGPFVSRGLLVNGTPIVDYQIASILIDDESAAVVGATMRRSMDSSRECHVELVVPGTGPAFIVSIDGVPVGAPAPARHGRRTKKGKGKGAEQPLPSLDGELLRVVRANRRARQLG